MSIRIPPNADQDLRNAFLDVGQALSDLSKAIERLNKITSPKVDAVSTNRLPDARKVFVPSGPMHAVGLVPDPPAVAGTVKFLREDGTWAVPA